MRHLPPRVLRPFIMGFLTTALAPSPKLFERGAVLVRDGAVVAFIALDVTTDGIRRLQWVLNPEKLERLPVPA